MLISIGCGASTGSVLNQPESIWKYKLLWSLQILCAVVICGERLDSHLFMVDPFFFLAKTNVYWFAHLWYYEFSIRNLLEAEADLDVHPT